MARKLKTCKKKLRQGLDTIQRPRSDAMKGMKFNTIEEAKDYFDSLYPGSNPTQVYKKLSDPSAPVEVRTFKGQKELDRVISTGEIMDKKAREHIRDIIGEPKLTNGIDRTNVALLNRDPSVGISDIKINHPELKATATTPVESKGIEMDSAAISGIGNIAGETVDTLDSKDNGKTSVGGAVLKGAGAGAAMGATIGGPWGAAIGGVIGGAAGGISSAINNKKIDKKLEEELQKKQLIEATKDIQPSQNTQSPIYEEGTYAAGMTQPVEVERDELVLRKNSLGKYRVVADFKGGKTHNQGGEDYVLKEGDVVFPGKKRKTIMNHLKTNNYPGIESERMKLPKDLPDTGELQSGIRGLPKYLTGAGDVFGITGLLSPERRALEALRWGSREEVSTPKPSNLPEDIRRIYPLPDMLGEMPSWLQSDVASQSQPKTQNSKVITAPKVERERVEPLNYTPQLGFSTPVINTPEMKSIGSVLPAPEAAQDRSRDENRGRNVGGNEDRGGSTSNVLSGIGDYAPSIANIIRGLQKPETETRRFLTPETLRYRDTSELLRKESDIQSRVDMENAARFSGGSGQVARAGKSLAGASRFRRSQAISSGEAQRAQGIEAQNIAIRNQASADNLQLANQYDALDAQNKAAVDAYFNQGIYDVGRVARQRKLDKKAESQQSLMLKMLEDRNFRYDEKGNLVEFKG